MTPAALRKLALSLPGAYEEPHFHRVSFRVGKKIFATMTPDGAEAMVRVAPIAAVRALLAEEPDVFFDYGGWTWKNGAVGARLAKVGAARMRALVTAAHERAAAPPKRTAKPKRTAR